MQSLSEEMRTMIEETRLAHPKLRAKASKELEPLLGEVSMLHKKLTAFEAKYMQTEGKLSDIGKVGRWVVLTDALYGLEITQASIKYVLQSLNVKKK